ncbi:MAG: arsenate reductase (glutaredoxin) [Gammaproteobacteria bacterium HGW-Gammaproteobacteria-2]|nr:MAG: arsenate reductase (glutaredoxin) [Gammaproteobacteria bacterium HGW-Gammaproteobacteria-2]
MNATIYHNPRCSKSRATLALLEHHGLTVKVIDYLANPPSVAHLRELVAKLNLPVTRIVRFGESLAKELGLAVDDARSATQWLELLHAHPALIERPIVVIGDRAVIGRPPENVLALLDSAC